MPDDDLARRFGEVAGQLNPAMIVVTTAAAGERSGCLVGFHSQCSIDPPQYAVWISKANHTFGFVEAATYFAVHVLGQDDQPLAELFGGETGDAVDKFAHCSWTEGPGGVPLIDGVASRFVGHKVGVTVGSGDHVCVVLEPIDATAGRVGEALHLSDEHHLESGHPA